MNKTEILMDSLTDYYKNSDYINKIIDIMNKKSIISRRLLDWFVTNYSKKNKIFIDNDIDIYQDYKLKLKSFGKKSFDPFCRETKVNFFYNENDLNQYIETSPGQLCFFKWCLESKILDYVEQHSEEIKNDMKESLERKSCTSVKKKREYSMSASKLIHRKRLTKSVKF